MGLAGTLTNSGLTNQDSDDFGVFVTSRRHKMAAYCDSFFCTGSNSGRMIRINAGGRPHDCPHCGKMLIYKQLKGVEQ